MLLVSLLLLAAQTHASYHDLGIPTSSATVDVRVFNVGFNHLTNATHTFATPVVPGHESVVFPMYSFLIEHKAARSGETTRLMFDLGIRKDPENLAPGIGAFYASGLAFVTGEDKDITEQLEDGGIPLSSIDAVIWSRMFWNNAHTDHIGDMSKFPNSTGIVYGPGTNTATFPSDPNSTLLESDFAGHNTTELDYSKSKLVFSGLPAIDYFGDGSFYLLNTPGHLAGHISALARVTPTSFISLGGDTFHHAGQARPQPNLQKAFPCPHHLLEAARTHVSTSFFWSPETKPEAFDLASRPQQMLAISDLPDSFYADPAAAAVSLQKVVNFDADEDVLVLVAHDASVVGSLPFFPKSLNGWKDQGLKQSMVWSFIDPENAAFLFNVSAAA
ncbi:hypothetical protein FB45DRAFT_1081614 [Roridomyces roridus]|uniref:Uncharacterized protein n=1 Tax=Roridomyces roridus TaxID=1738132 RepID=A0AAD7BP43_9AGAR|nr:hypothetical protein FB45DRAFT_1081614 [Roridomyces roridus]